MNQYLTGAVIRSLREARHLTQSQLAERLNVSDKTVSKWETGRGWPDITLLEPIAKEFGISVAELLSGSASTNRNVAANMLRTQLYVCPVCGNILLGAGEAVISCHGLRLFPQEAEESGGAHSAELSVAEDEYYLQFDHPMTREHCITFAAALSTDGVQLVRLYPEGAAACRLKISGTEKIYYYCNRDGLFSLSPAALKEARRRG